MKSLLGTSDLDESINIIKDKNKIFAITLGEKGAMIVNNEEVVKIEPQKIDNLVDTTGAGDLFAAGFLLKYLQGQTLEECGKEAVRFASKVIQMYGARL